MEVARGMAGPGRDETRSGMEFTKNTQNPYSGESEISRCSTEPKCRFYDFRELSLKPRSGNAVFFEVTSAFFISQENLYAKMNKMGYSFHFFAILQTELAFKAKNVAFRERLSKKKPIDAILTHFGI